MWARMKRMWRWFRTPSGGIAAGTLILGGVLFAAVSWPTCWHPIMTRTSD